MATPKFFWDSAYLQKHNDELGESDCVMLLLSPISFMMLTDMSKMLLWDTRYTDGVDWIGERAYEEMNNPSCVEVNVDMTGSIDKMQSIVDAMLEMVKAIKEREDMINNQTVTINGCGCGGGSSSYVSGTIPDDDVPEGYDTPTIDPTVDENAVAVKGTDKCNRSGYLWVTYRNAVLGVLENITSGFTGFAVWLSDLWDWIGEVQAGYGDWLQIKSLVDAGNVSGFDEFLASFDANFNALVCSTYTASTAKEAKDAGRDMLEQYVWNGLGTYQRLAIKAMYEFVPFGFIFDGSYDANIPPGYEGRECCGSVPIDLEYDYPDVPEEWLLIPVSGDIATVSGHNYCVSTMDEYGLLNQVGTGTQTYKQVHVTYDPADVDATKDHIGTLYVVEEPEMGEAFYQSVIDGVNTMARGLEIYKYVARLNDANSASFTAWVQSVGGRADGVDPTDYSVMLQLTVDQNAPSFGDWSVRVFAVFRA